MGFLEDLPPYRSGDPGQLGRAVIGKVQAPYRTREEDAALAAEDEARLKYQQGQQREADATQFARGRAEVGLPTPQAPPPSGPPSPLLQPPAPPVDYSHFQEDVRNSLAGAPRGFIDERVDSGAPTPLDPNGPRALPAPPRARAVMLPNGKILLTNQDSGPSGQSYAGQELAGKELYDAVGKRGAGVSSAQRAGLDASGHHPSLNGTPMQSIPDDLPIEGVRDYLTQQARTTGWQKGTYFEGGPEKDLGHQATDERFALKRNPDAHWDEKGQGAYSQLEATPDQKVQIALEDAARAAAVYRGQADVETARQSAQDAGMSAEERAQATAASRAPELLGMQAIRQEQIRAQRALQEYDRRSADPSDPAYVEPNQRRLARAKIQSDLEENIKVLASVVGRQKQLPEGLLGLGG